MKKTKKSLTNTPNQTRESSVWIFISIGILIALIAFVGIFFVESPSDLIDSDKTTCIAESSQLFVSTGCSYCTKQKQNLGDDLELFDIIDCRENPQDCTKAGIEVVPTWIINGIKYRGLMSAEKLEALTGC